MKCSNCGYENAEGTKFCVHCGTPLMQTQQAAPQQAQPQAQQYAPQQTQGQYQQAPQGQQAQAAYQQQYQQAPQGQQPYQQPYAQTAYAAVPQQPPKKKGNAGKIIGIVVAVIVVLAVLVSLAGGGQKTLQDCLTQEEWQAIEDEASSEWGSSVEVSCTDNNLHLTVSLPGDASDYSGTDWDSVWESIEPAESQVISELEDEYDLTGVTVTVTYIDASDSTIAEHTFS